VLILAGIGLIMSMQSVSLFSGTGTLWTGVGLAAAGTAAAFFLGAAKWARVIAALCLVVALAATVFMEQQMNEKREEISAIFDS
jgi:O-antigen ligase